MSGKREEIDLLRADADNLTESSYWSADKDCLGVQLTALDDQCTSLDDKVCRALQLLLQLFCAALCNINDIHWFSNFHTFITGSQLSESNNTFHSFCVTR